MEIESTLAVSSRRRSLRRAVQLEAEVSSPAWRDSVTLMVSDLSAHGMWLESDLILTVGDQLSLCFDPPHWQGLPTLRADATVVRVSLLRRHEDSGCSAGMGVSFTGLAPGVARGLECALRGLPPPLPARLQADAALLESDATQLCLEDGRSYCWVAEAPLLTSSLVAPPSAAVLELREAVPERSERRSAHAHVRRDARAPVEQACVGVLRRATHG
jgi:PilZ domain